MSYTKVKLLALFAVMTGLISSCSYEKSSVTGWDYNNPAYGGFQKVPYEEQETGPGLILIEGGTFTMGRVEQETPQNGDNVPRRVTVSSFYMDETEVKNFDWCEYLYWVGRTYTDFPMVYKKALPDTLCWREKLAYNEPYVDYYLRHPSYRDYPVVGVNWLQATNFCAWRTDRVNEQIMIREGIIIPNPEKYFLPKHDLNTNYLIAKSSNFLIYPNEYNRFVNYYNNSFQHGGISLEEMVVPIAELKGKNG